MVSFKSIKEEDVDLCYELDSNTISFWSKRQWASELKKEGIKVFGISFEGLIVGICVFHVVLDEAQINYFVIEKKYRRRRFGSYLMSYLIRQCEKLNITKLFLEVSHSNVAAEKFYSRFDFLTIGIRRNYYKNGSDALLKEKKLTTK